MSSFCWLRQQCKISRPQDYTASSADPLPFGGHTHKAWSLTKEHQYCGLPGLNMSFSGDLYHLSPEAISHPVAAEG